MDYQTAVEASIPRGRSSSFSPSQADVYCFCRVSYSPGYLFSYTITHLTKKSEKRGDVHTLRKICGEGVMASFLSRIQARNPRERYEWKLHKYTKFTRVVSDRAVRLPMELSGQRQAVVRIQSRQSLTKYRPDGSVVPGTGQEKELREYVVIQKRLLNGKEEPWFVWGTTEETTLEEVERRERRKRGEE